MLNKKAKLKSTLHSFSNPKIVYGKAGDTITVISIREHVAIVEAEDGNRFPIILKELEFDNTIEIEQQPLPEIIQPLPTPKKKSTPKVQQSQQSLF